MPSQNRPLLGVGRLDSEVLVGAGRDARKDAEGFLDFGTRRSLREHRKNRRVPPLGMTTFSQLRRKSSLKSRHFGFSFSINATFLSRRHRLSCFSLVIAARTSPKASKYTRRVTLYLFEKPERSF